MGLESYLFQLNFKKLLTAHKISSTLKNLGFRKVKSDHFNLNFELVSDEGIIECQLFNLIPFLFYVPTRKSLFFRFAVSNPPMVIQKSISLLTKINTSFGGIIIDVRHNKVFRINDLLEIKEVTERILLQKKGFDALYGKIDQPIRCNDAWEYLELYGKGEWSHNFIKKEYKFPYPTTKPILLRLSGCLGLPLDIEQKAVNTLIQNKSYTEKELVNLLVEVAKKEQFKINPMFFNQLLNQRQKNLFFTYNKTKKCPECRGQNVFKSKKQNELICQDCGLVIEPTYEEKNKQ